MLYLLEFNAMMVTKGKNYQRFTMSLMMVATDVQPKRTIIDQIGTASIASAAVLAASAVNTAVGMRQLSAPDTTRTYVYRDGGTQNRTGIVDSVGLPLVYDKDLIQAYWKKQSGALSQRWSEFLGYAIPFLTRIVTVLISGGPEELKNNGASLARDARIIFEKLGPTYVKLGQMMSVRPDVLPPEALLELKILQDSVKPFDTVTAINQVESELGNKLGAFFTEISNEPVAAASLAQVYKARLITGEYVAVKIQRPKVLETVSKDLYVLRRAAEVYQGLIDRFAPQQRTDYVALLNEWAVGFYTELDFLNEAANQDRLKKLLIEEGVSGVYVPKVYPDLCTRRLLVTEWIDGKKLSDCPPEEIKMLIPAAQEAFLTQLLQIGFFHSDPHPGNLMVMSEARVMNTTDTPSGNSQVAKLALIDFGLVASLKQTDMDKMVSAIIHLANRDYESLVDDFIQLEILPTDCDRVKVVPLMDKALTPYVKGGGAKKYEEELKRLYGMEDGSLVSTAGGFQAMTQDALTVLNDIPFSIPPYFALLARAIVTLEGIALTGDPNYGIITEAYPFVARKLLSEDRPEIQKALYAVLYAKDSDNGSDGSGDGRARMKTNRLAVLLNSALGVVARSSDALVDLDTLPDEAVDLGVLMSFILSEKASSLRGILIEEGVAAIDLLARQSVRKTYSQFISRLPRPPSFLSSFTSSLPPPQEINAPWLVPTSSSLAINNVRVVRTNLQTLVEAIAPKLSREEEFYAASLKDLISQTLGQDASVVANGDSFSNPSAALRFLLNIVSSNFANVPFIDNSIIASASSNILKLIPSNSNNAPLTESNGASLKSVINSLTDLSQSEDLTLRTSSSEVLEKISNRLISRLQAL